MATTLSQIIILDKQEVSLCSLVRKRHSEIFKSFFKTFYMYDLCFIGSAALSTVMCHYFKKE